MVKLILQREQRQAQYFTEDLDNDVDLNMVLIPSGSFWMGTEESEIEKLVKEYDHEWFKYESPQHKVAVPYFFMGRYPITQAQWKEVASWERVERKLESDPSRFKEDYEGIDRWTRPVEQVSWEDAKEFCARLTEKTGREYRLPTEAEWEYACRSVIPIRRQASNQSSVINEDMTVEEWNQEYHQPFHFGETISTELANYNGNYVYGKGAKGEYREQTTPVGYFQVANNFGLSDMHGNVWEWCEDDWQDNYKKAPDNGNALSLKDSSNKVVRGGSWCLNPSYCRSAYRLIISRAYRLNYIGFRVVCAAPRTT